MRGRKPGKFKLKTKDGKYLHQLLREGETPIRVARRAQILLGRAKAHTCVETLGETIDQTSSTIWRVCERYRQHGLQAALYDAPRSGRPRVFSPPDPPPD
jgi:hypothetical protein